MNRKQRRAVGKSEEPDEPAGFVDGTGQIHYYPGPNGKNSPEARRLLARLEENQRRILAGEDVFHGHQAVVESMEDVEDSEKESSIPKSLWVHSEEGPGQLYIRRDGATAIAVFSTPDHLKRYSRFYGISSAMYQMNVADLIQLAATLKTGGLVLDPGEDPDEVLSWLVFPESPLSPHNLGNLHGSFGES
jgi:hypothetical protein